MVPFVSCLCYFAVCPLYLKIFKAFQKIFESHLITARFESIYNILLVFVLFSFVLYTSITDACM